MDTLTKRKVTVELEAGMGDAADRYIAAENERIAPAKLSLTALINAALRKYIATVSDDSARAA